MKKITYAILASSILLATGCSTLSNSVNSALGVPVGQKTQDYVVSGAGGIIAGIAPKSAVNSTYRYGFSIDLKTAESVRSVKIERLNKDGSKTLIIDDSASSTRSNNWQKQQPNDAQSKLYGKGLGNVSWVGQSQSYNMTKEQASWLYQSGTTHETYLITITDNNGKVTELKQPTQIPAQAKSTYLSLLQ
ncbi:hypothetical protein SAMN02745664_12028 [Moraxella cuniculi DSM 21768]|uniref:Lipoprotein n=1 Tax=Moraxella cuniculi DSM 21768 TaxID=1122245 RepID=A0A1N7FZB6_9GAMM|nr:hypothetical protein [Moraxella cuniculi]OOS04219.1 hypothetical protein B0189_08865 [Moraxella cuniculi]SIS05692.1 hypothetical protein SAMN02745664_12028 [Moraxella cuniculi DSM 21768]